MDTKPSPHPKEAAPGSIEALGEPDRSTRGSGYWVRTWSGVMDPEQMQAMAERMQMLEEALDRAEAGVATPDDWKTIRNECGFPARKP